MRCNIINSYIFFKYMRIPFFDVDYDEDSDEETSYVYKNIFVVGASKAGKTSIIKRLTKNSSHSTTHQRLP